MRKIWEYTFITDYWRLLHVRLLMTLSQSAIWLLYIITFLVIEF